MTDDRAGDGGFLADGRLCLAAQCRGFSCWDPGLIRQLTVADYEVYWFAAHCCFRTVYWRLMQRR